MHPPQRRNTTDALRLALALVLSACALVTTAACTQTTAEDGLLQDPETDTRRDRALAVFPGRKSTDEVRADEGDSIDWKYIDVRQAGALKVAISLDQPSQVKGQLTLRDNFANLIERQEVTRDRSVYVFETVQATPGRYYVQFECFNGGSVYTVGASFSAVQVAGFTRPTGFERVDPDEPTSSSSSRRPRRPRPATTATTTTPEPAKPDTTKPDETPTDTKPDTPPEEPGMVTISAAIRRVTPTEDGGALLALTVTGENSDKIKAGTQGTIAGLGASVVIRRRSGNSATGFTKADPEKVKSKTAVVFKVKP